MPSWIGQAAHRGRLTTRYPEERASLEEVPSTGRPPTLVIGTTAAPAAVTGCPVGAISETQLDRGRCIRCARCLSHGFEFAGPVEQTGGRPADLVGALGAAEPRAAANAPLGPLGRSVHVYLVDVGSCNACNLEVLALANPFYDSQRLGIFFTNSPRHADVLLVVGVPSDGMVDPLRRAYEALPSPKAVIAVGVCPTSGGAFRGNPGVRPSLEGIVPVDRFVPGCPPTPVQILDAILSVVGRSRQEGP